MKKAPDEPEDAEREMLEEKVARKERQSFAQAFAEVTRDEDALDAELTEKLREEMAYAKQSTEPAPFTEYRVDDFLQLIQLEIYALTQSDVIVKRCKILRSFLPDRSADRGILFPDCRGRDAALRRRGAETELQQTAE